MKASLKERKEIALGTFLFTYDLGEQEFVFKAGQWFFIEIPNPPYTDERGNRRHFSIVNSPTQKGIITMATRIGENSSAFKRSLREIPLGTQVEIEGPRGIFGLPQESTMPLVFIAGGIGITPFMSMLGYVHDQKLPYTITLFYSNSTPQTTAFASDLEKLAEEIPQFKLVSIITQDPNWTGEKRRVDAAVLEDHLKTLEDKLYFVVGPPQMATGTQEMLIQAGIASENIKRESFTGY